MIRLADLETGENLAFFGSHDGERWERIGRAVKTAEQTFVCENPFGAFRYFDMRSEDHSVVSLAGAAHA